MNKIVREHYPVANLPKDLREGFEGLDTVTVLIKAEAKAKQGSQDFWSVPLDQIRPRSREQFKQDLQEIRSSGLQNVSPEEAVRRIRELRDEWDDE